MQSISVFEFTNKQIRTIVIDGEVWFVAKDICDMLEVGNVTDAMKRLAESMKGVDTIETLGGIQRMNIINEPGVYKLAFTSRKPEAEAFTEYVAGTILPTIRKTGSYSAKPMSQIELIAASAQALLDQDRRLNLVEKKQDAMIEALTAPAMMDWAADMNYRINMICKSRNKNYQTYRHELYAVLEATAHVNLKARQDRLKDRMRAAGHKSKDIQSVTQIHVIADDPKLRAIFESIVRTEQVKYAGGEAS